MRVVLFMAMSLNGMIADAEGREDFLSHANWDSFCAMAKVCDGFVIGRQTYDIVKTYYSVFGFDDLEGCKIIVSANGDYTAPPGYIRARSPQDALGKAQAFGLDTVLLTGGATVNSHFLNEHLVNEVRINVEPVLVGQGLNLVAPQLAQCRLAFIGSQSLEEGIVQLRYLVTAQ